MNDAEKLAIAKRLAIAALHERTWIVVSKSPRYLMRCSHKLSGWKYFVESDSATGATMLGDFEDCPLLALHKFEAKLASEREAALPEEAKRWREALERIVNECHYGGLIADIARKALEPGA